MSNIEILNDAIGSHPILSGFTVAVLAGVTLALFKKYVINRDSPNKITIEGEQLIKDLFEAKKGKELPFTIDDYKKLNDQLKELERELSEEKDEKRKAEIKLSESALIIGRDAAKMALEGKIEEAKERFQQAINTFPEVMVINLYGIFLVRIGELDDAITLFKTVVNIGEKSNNKVVLAAGFGNLGNIYQIRGDLDRAEEYFIKALDINKDLSRKEGMANQYGNLGNIYRIKGALDKAEEFCEKALGINKDLSRKEGMANQYGNLGIIYEIRGDLDKAEEYCIKALDIDRELGNKEGMAIQYTNLGNNYRIRDDIDKAEEYFIKALDINKEVGSKEGMAVNKWNISIIKEKQSKLSEALELTKEARDLYEQVGIPHDVEKADKRIAHLQKLIDEQK